MTATEQRLKELEWGLARLLGPREPQLVRRDFGVFCSSDGGRTYLRAYPVQIGVDGVDLISTQEPTDHNIAVTLELEDRRVKATARCTNSQKGLLNGSFVWKISAKFIRIAQDDRALIDRYVRRLPLNAVGPSGGVLPPNVMGQVLNKLVELKRLNPLRNGARPLIKVAHTGVTERGKHMAHGFRIESRYVHDGHAKLYVTQVYVSDSFSKIELIPVDNGLREVIEPTFRRSAQPR